jgi:translocation and assembly module TamB
LREPAAVGAVSIHDGVIQFPFANLRVEQGLIFLTSENPYRPRLQVYAAARAFGYEIKMEVTGAADEPIVQFSSTPALSSEQIVLMLTTGEMPGGNISFSRQQRAGRMALFVGRGLLSKLTGGEGTSDRLTIRSGESVSPTGNETYYIEYKLSEDWSLIGEYDRFSAFNAGVKWKFYSK